jgi:hypothetical protein
MASTYQLHSRVDGSTAGALDITLFRTISRYRSCIGPTGTQGSVPWLPLGFQSLDLEVALD